MDPFHFGSCLSLLFSWLLELWHSRFAYGYGRDVPITHNPITELRDSSGRTKGPWLLGLATVDFRSQRSQDRVAYPRQTDLV